MSKANDCTVRPRELTIVLFGAEGADCNGEDEKAISEEKRWWVSLMLTHYQRRTALDNRFHRTSLVYAARSVLRAEAGAARRLPPMVAQPRVATYNRHDAVTMKQPARPAGRSRAEPASHQS